MRPGPLLAALAIAGAAAGLALGQGTPVRPILHERLPEPAAERPSPMIGAGSGGGNPAAIVAGEKTLPKPSLETRPSDPQAEPVLGKGGFAADRSTSLNPDENTGPDSTLHYVSVFNPDVLPFKRMSALDQVHGDQTLHVANTAQVELPVGGTTDPATRDRFWGDVLVQLKPGVDVPLPSVAPDMRILSYETKPRVALRFSKDGADNFFVRSDDSSASGTYRIVFLADADYRYFAASWPDHRYRVRDVAAHAPPELRIPVPDEVERDADAMLGRIGVDRDMELEPAFNKLVAYFRSFRPGDVPHPTGDIYVDLTRSQAGVCRHRAFAFMITANALGIPTRFVENEAHAFVEVWFPERNWQRVDLGGAALRMDVTGANDKTLHRPRSADPFEEPAAYRNNYTQLEGEIGGLSASQIADKRRGLDKSPPSGATGPDLGQGSGSGSGSGSGGPRDRISPDPGLPTATADPKKQTPQLVVTAADASAYRGARLHVEGMVRANGKGLADHDVNVFLALPGDHHTATQIGIAVTKADGTFAVDLAIPASLAVSTYDVLLSSDDDAYYNAALSE
ncbi:MAG TPA: transglutaminase domain-containing protein [Kofleriaceae bacterium]|nr:transglutaminase domain-containing protein [Kofleriaceae bacterium]